MTADEPTTTTACSFDFFERFVHDCFRTTSSCSRARGALRQSVSRLVAANEQINSSICQNSIDTLKGSSTSFLPKSVSTNITRSKDKNQVSIAKAKGLRGRCTAWIEFPNLVRSNKSQIGLLKHFRNISKKTSLPLLDHLLCPLLIIQNNSQHQYLGCECNGVVAFPPFGGSKYRIRY